MPEMQRAGELAVRAFKKVLGAGLAYYVHQWTWEKEQERNW